MSLPSPRATGSSGIASSSASLGDLRWHRAVCRLICTRSVPGRVPPAIVSLQAIVKHVSSALAGAEGGVNPERVLFHVSGKRFSYRPLQNDALELCVLFCRASSQYVQRWVAELEAYCRDPAHKANFAVAEVAELRGRTYADLESELQLDPTAGEVCLDFLVPVPFKPPSRRERTHLDKEQFIRLLEQRFSGLFGRPVRYLPGEDDFFLLPYYWKYTEIRHPSLSQPGTTQYIKGCFGPLYVKGSYRNLVPLLVLGAELHTGAKKPYAQGYYVLRQPGPPYFARFFPSRKSLVTVIQDVRERYDQEPSKPERGMELVADDEQLADELYRQLSNDEYVPGPSTAYVIEKKGSGKRTLEQFTLRDLIVHQYLLRTIEGPFDRFFEEGSVGYRKGMSRERAAQMIQAAVADRYAYVLESDISDFFPSVDLDRLSQLLDRFVPQQDTLLKRLLEKCIRSGYLLDGTLHQRTQGLAQGSPLSPILANLYLDAFDEYFAARGVKLVRYADDFIILTRTGEEAERMVGVAKEVLGELGLALKREKTAIKSVQEGFEFLGITFSRTDIRVAPEEELRRFKKPLYITEPYLFLSLNGEAITILKNGVPLETIPLRRLSEIMVLERVSLSSALLKRLVEANIPLTLTLGSGYYITTVKPDSKQYYSLVSEHGARYGRLSPAEVLALAKEIAAIKVRNAVSLFRQKYIAGNNRLIAELGEAAGRIEQAADIHEVRGLEGAAARKAYQGLNTLIDDPHFHLRRRERSKPDRINSLLNFGYYLLYARINATVRAVGLNPYLGFLHAPEDSYESLVADIQELFRARIDRFLVRLINLKIVGRNDFLETERGAYLTSDAKRRFLHHFELELHKRSGKENLSLLEWLYYQVIVFRKWARGEGSLTFYRWEV